MSAKSQDTRALSYALQVDIDAPRDAVWRALTEQIDAWWLPDFHMIAADSVVRFDARAGGQLVEEQAGGGSLLWYTVAMCAPGESLHLVGHLAPPWGGPATTMLHLALEERDGGTRLAVTDSLFGVVDEKAAAQQEEGWRQLFEAGLKAHVEAG